MIANIRSAFPLILSRAMLALAFCALLSCASSWRKSIGAEWMESVEVGTDFQHRVFFKPGVGNELHIYIEGDGNIWRTPQQLYPDPTPERPLTIALMRRDPAPALLLGRPCYFEVHDSHCSPRWWTAARYSETVVASMADVARRWANRYSTVTLIGYSGGGAIATLMAPRLPSIRAVVTVAGNLDVDAWVQHHRYNSAIVAESLDPARQPPLSPDIEQWHYAGAGDDNVLPVWIANFSARQRNAHFRSIGGFDHRCCWSQRWPGLLAPAAANSPPISGDQNSSR